MREADLFSYSLSLFCGGECLLLAQSGHPNRAERRLLSEVKRTFAARGYRATPAEYLRRVDTLSLSRPFALKS